MLCQAKVASNVESSVGLLTLAGRSARILITSTRDLGRIFTCMHDVDYDGHADVVAGIKKAQLALKHRQNALQRQRIVVFVSSPIDAPTEVLVRLGKMLKKNNVAVDVINVGSEADNTEKIDAFVGAVNSNDNSHVLHVSAGGGVTLADAIMTSDINLDDGGGGAAGAGVGAGGAGGAAGDFGGLDESADPELEMALRISMEEERARQAAARAAEQQQPEAAMAEGATAGDGTTSAATEGAKTDGDGSGGGAASSADAADGGASGKYDEDDGDLYGTGGGENMDVDYADEEAEMLRRAIELSNQEAQHAAEMPAATQEEEATNNNNSNNHSDKQGDKDGKGSDERAK